MGQYQRSSSRALGRDANATGEGRAGNTVALRGQAEALLGSVRLADEITQGAISSAGALSPRRPSPCPR